MIAWLFLLNVELAAMQQHHVIADIVTFILLNRVNTEKGDAVIFKYFLACSIPTRISELSNNKANERHSGLFFWRRTGCTTNDHK